MSGVWLSKASPGEEGDGAAGAVARPGHRVQGVEHGAVEVVRDHAAAAALPVSCCGRPRAAVP